MHKKHSINDITAIILAGGKGMRIGKQNKGLLDLNGETFVSHLLKKLAPQSATQILSVNDDIPQYQQYSKTLVQDEAENYQGPLSGIISCKSQIKTSLVLTVPCDSPTIPTDLSERLLNAHNEHTSTPLCVVHDGKRLQNLFMLFDVNLLKNMEEYFLNDRRSVYSWIQQHAFQEVDFSDKADLFINVNDQTNFDALQRLISSDKFEK